METLGVFLTVTWCSCKASWGGGEGGRDESLAHSYLHCVFFQKKTKLENSKKPGFDQERLEETTCYLRDGEKHMPDFYDILISQ